MPGQAADPGGPAERIRLSAGSRTAVRSASGRRTTNGRPKRRDALDARQRAHVHSRDRGMALVGPFIVAMCLVIIVARLIDLVGHRHHLVADVIALPFTVLFCLLFVAATVTTWRDLFRHRANRSGPPS